MKRFLVLMLLCLGFALAQSSFQAPDFTLYDTNGKIVKLSSFRGKPVIVNFWATWCEICAEEMPKMNRAFVQAKGKYVFLAVHADPNVPVTEVKQHVQAQGWSFPALVNPPKGKGGADSVRAVVSRYNASGTPFFYFVDKQGLVKAVHPGAMDDATFAHYLTLIGVK